MCEVCTYESLYKYTMKRHKLAKHKQNQHEQNGNKGYQELKTQNFMNLLKTNNTINKHFKILYW